MSKIKYHYNPKTFQYEHARIGVRDVLWYVTGVLFTSLVLFGAMVTAHDSFFDSETEKSLRYENRVLGKHKDILENQLNHIEVTLASLKEDDKTLYARLFSTELPESPTVGPTLSKEEVLLAEASNFRKLIKELEARSDQLKMKSRRTSTSFADHMQLSKSDVEEISAIPSIQPIANPQLELLVSGFGERINPFHKGKYVHPGLDFAAPRDTKVVATAPGKVVATNKTRLQAGYGNYLDIDHGNGFVTRYAHLEDIRVHRGQSVSKAQVIGTVGSSGGSIAPHLHYEVIRNGEQVNPIHFLIEGLSSEEHHTLLLLSTKQNQSLD